MVQTWDFLSKIMEHGDSSIFHQWLEHGSWGTVSHPNSRKLFDSMGNVPLGQSHGAVITLLANWGSMFGVQSVWPLGKSSIHLLVTRWCWMQVSLDLWPCCLENEDLNLKLHTHTSCLDVARIAVYHIPIHPRCLLVSDHLHPLTKANSGNV